MDYGNRRDMLLRAAVQEKCERTFAGYAGMI